MVPVLILCAGCECFLPDGKAPEGNIIEPSGEEHAVELIFDRTGAADYFINELIRETMLNCPGEAVFLDADRQSLSDAHRILLKTGEFSGITHAVKAPGNWKLVSRNSAGTWQMELVSASGNVVWKRSVILKNN